jgi:hypothetical protein
MTKRNEAPARTLNVLSVFYQNKEVVKRNRAGNALRAVGKATEYMRQNKYEADVVEVYNDENADVYAVLTVNKAGEFKTVFEKKYNAKKGI